MSKLMITTFLGLGLVFFEMSGGTDFEPQSWDDVAAVEATADGAPAPQVTRGQTASLIAVRIRITETGRIGWMAERLLSNT